MFGWRSDPETFYRASDIFAFPSRSESFGNALAEAMAHGLAVVTTPVGLARHWIRDGENGILVPGDEPGLLEEPEVARDARLRHAKDARELGDVEAILGEHAEQPEPRGVAEQPKQGGCALHAYL